MQQSSASAHDPQVIKTKYEYCTYKDSYFSFPSTKTVTS